MPVLAKGGTRPHLPALQCCKCLRPVPSPAHTFQPWQGREWTPSSLPTGVCTVGEEAPKAEGEGLVRGQGWAFTAYQNCTSLEKVPTWWAFLPTPCAMARGQGWGTALWWGGEAAFRCLPPATHCADPVWVGRARVGIHSSHPACPLRVKGGGNEGIGLGLQSHTAGRKAPTSGGFSPLCRACCGELEPGQGSIPHSPTSLLLPEGLGRLPQLCGSQRPGHSAGPEQGSRAEASQHDHKVGLAGAVMHFGM